VVQIGSDPLEQRQTAKRPVGDHQQTSHPSTSQGRAPSIRSGCSVQ
jgi:hypothetical protein